MANDDLALKLDRALQFGALQMETLAEDVLSGNNQFVDYSNTAGVWNIKNSSTWCSGFIPGLFWYLYDQTGEAIWMERAALWTNGVRSRASDADNDTGFQIFDSFGLGYLSTGETNRDYLAVLRTGAATLYNQRYQPVIGCYRSWPGGSSNTTDLPFEVNIDQMMNLELPLFIGYRDSNQSYIDAAISHADKTWDNNVRENGSTYHVVSYNLDGTVASKRTHQGWTTDSTWSRGQAWAVYGYTMVYRYTQLDRMLQRAEACFDYFDGATKAQSTDAIPYSDFDAPLDSNNPRDSSAAAIVASAALELYDLTDNEKYLDAACDILSSLSGPDYLSKNTGYQSILRKASEKWSRPEVAAIFADYFFVEAGLRYLELFPIDSSAGKLINISTRGRVGSGDNALIGGFVIRDGTQQVLIQAIGPELSNSGVTTPLADPMVTLYDADMVAIASNDDWESDQKQLIEDLWKGMAPMATGSKSAAIVQTLSPGAYTAIVSGKNDTEGVALVEVYEVD